MATISLGAHLIAMAVLFQFSVRGKAAPTPADIRVAGIEEPDLRPAPRFVATLSMRRLPHHLPLQRVGIAGQADAIRAGLERVLASQRDDGSFGDAPATAYATLALLAEGDCSATDTRRGRAIRAAMRILLHEAQEGAPHGAILTALVEDWALSFDSLSELERGDYIRGMLRMIRALGDEDAASREGLATARAANLPVPASRRLGIFDEQVVELIERAPTRLSATRVLARGRNGLGYDRLKKWVQPLFERAKARIEAGSSDPVAVLTLQSPYRL